MYTVVKNMNMYNVCTIIFLAKPKKYFLGQILRGVCMCELVHMLVYMCERDRNTTCLHVSLF